MRVLLVILLAWCSVAISCSSGETTLVVSAASSLTEAFESLAARFEEEHPGTDVVLNTAGSQRLATQILEGAEVDVFASADTAQMDRVADAGLLFDARRIVALNELVIVVEAGNASEVGGLGDLSRDDLTVVLAAPDVPAGAYTRRALDSAEVEVDPASLEPDVRAVLSKVRLGEADAGIVYRSDVATAPDEVTAVEIDPEHNVVASYPIARLRETADREMAEAFIAFATSTQGRAVLQLIGFTVP